MTKADLQQLADEIERAAAGSRELSDGVLLALGWQKAGGIPAWLPPEKEEPSDEWMPEYKLPDPTRCLDDVAGLRLDGWSFETTVFALNYGEAHCAGVWADKVGYINPTPKVSSHAAGQHAEARARCAALLRAVAAESDV